MKLIVAPGQVTELRALGVSTPEYRRTHTVSGYFDDIHALAQAAVQIAPDATEVYFVVPENLRRPRQRWGGTIRAGV
jgi:hypothetical protein